MLTRLLCVLVALSLALPAAAQTRGAPASREVVRLSFAPVVKKAAPAVVNVFSRRIVRSGGGPAALFNDPFFRRFFGDQSPLRLPRARVEQSLGSGLLLAAARLIVPHRPRTQHPQE